MCFGVSGMQEMYVKKNKKLHPGMFDRPSLAGTRRLLTGYDRPPPPGAGDCLAWTGNVLNCTYAVLCFERDWEGSWVGSRFGILRRQGLVPGVITARVPNGTYVVINNVSRGPSFRKEIHSFYASPFNFLTTSHLLALPYPSSPRLHVFVSTLSGLPAATKESVENKGVLNVYLDIMVY